MKMTMGANVLFCGHAGYFIADVYNMGSVVAIKASAPVNASNIHRHNEFGPATHHVLDFPTPGLWAPDRGVFVVPKKQFRAVKP